MPKIVDHDQYREELTTKCIDLFSRWGYANVTMREVARKLGVSTGTLYHYFPTKEAIFAKMFEHLRQSDVATVMAQASGLGSAGDKLRVYGDHWIQNREYYQNILLLSIDFFRNNEMPDIEKVMRGFSNYYRDAMASNLEVPEPFARMLFIFMIGLFYHDLLIPDTGLFREQLDLFLDVAIVYIEEHFKDREAESARSGSAELGGANEK